MDTAEWCRPRAIVNARSAVACFFPTWGTTTHMWLPGPYSDEWKCAHCGWFPELPSSHVGHGFIDARLRGYEKCPTLSSGYEVWMDEDRGLCVRKRDLLWVVPRLLAWSRRACARVQREYAPDGVRGREIIDAWDLSV